MPAIAASLEELLADAEGREPFVNPDGRSLARFERVVIDGRPHILKHLHLDDDAFQRVAGDIGCAQVRAWAAGLLDRAPEHVDHAIVGATLGQGRNGWGGSLLMRDVSGELLPHDGSTIPPDDHASFLRDIAALCVATWGWHDGDEGISLVPYPARWTWFGVGTIASEEALGWPERVPLLARDGWKRFTARAPEHVARAVGVLRHDVTPLASALAHTPSCLLHGDVKASNTGRSRDGRTVLIDWTYVGEGPACHELAWHLALDRARLPVSKEATIARFREALEQEGVDTEPWWDRQLGLALLGAVVQFGWEKALGDDDELAWWCDAARRGLAWL